MFISAIHPKFNTVIASNNISIIDAETSASTHCIDIVGCSGSFLQDSSFEGEHFIGVDEDGDILQFVLHQSLIFAIQGWKVVTDETLLNIVRNELKVQQMMDGLGFAEIKPYRGVYAITQS
jgi:hypothetical protein